MHQIEALGWLLPSRGKHSGCLTVRVVLQWPRQRSAPRARARSTAATSATPATAPPAAAQQGASSSCRPPPSMCRCSALPKSHVAGNGSLSQRCWKLFPVSRQVQEAGELATLPYVRAAAAVLPRTEVQRPSRHCDNQPEAFDAHHCFSRRQQHAGQRRLNRKSQAWHAVRHMWGHAAFCLICPDNCRVEHATAAGV